MEEEKKEEGKKTTIALALTPITVFLGALVLGIILLVIGIDSTTSALADIGIILTTLSLFGGALLLPMEGYLRLGLAIAAGFILANASSAIGLSGLSIY